MSPRPPRSRPSPRPPPATIPDGTRTSTSSAATPCSTCSATTASCTPEETERWKAYPLLLSSRSDFSGVAEYFVEYVRQQLDARFGPTSIGSGYRIYTTLDLDMQQAAERALEARLEAIESGADGKFPHQTYRQYMDSRADTPENSDKITTPYLQGLVVTLEAKTGSIRAMVGGRDFDDSKFNRATQALRQPGSTFKPIVYSAAVEAGYPLSHVMVDDPLSVEIDPTQEPWTPQNYDLEFDGPMTLRRALYMSRNIIAVKLGMEIGEEAVISEATKFGITTRIPPYPSIHIGSADVIPLEMISAYTTFANLGTRTLPNAILRVEDRTGKIVWQPAVRSVPVMDTVHAWLMTDALRDVVRHGTAVGSVGARINFPAGGKTGTTNDGFDVWYIGFTPDLVTGVWIGFDQPQEDQGQCPGRRTGGPGVDRDDARGIRAANHPACLAQTRRTHGARHRQDHRLQGNPVLPEGSALHRIVHPRHRADGFLSHPLAIRSGGNGGHDRYGAGDLAWTAPHRASPRVRRLPERGAGHRSDLGSHGRDRSGTQYSAVAMPARRLAARWLLPIDGPPVEHAALLIGADGKIAALGPDASVPRPPDVDAESFGDAILLPGLINTHTHLELTGLAEGAPEEDFPAWIRRLRRRKAERSAEEFLAAAHQGFGIVGRPGSRPSATPVIPAR